jgi:hypothetical protein
VVALKVGRRLRAARRQHVSRLVIDNGDEEDVTLTFEQDGRAERMLVALSDGRAFPGLDSPSGVAQVARPPRKALWWS